MRVAFVNLAHAPELSSPFELLDEYRSLTGWTEGLVAAGADLDVVQGFSRDAYLERGGVRYHFLAGRYAPRLSRRRVAWGAARAVRRLAPDVVHLNGLLFFLSAPALRAALPGTSVLVAQHHAERPEEGPAAWLQRRALRAVDGFLFSGRGMAEPWLERRLILPHRPIFEVLEGSSSFSPGDRDTARDATGMHGDPACLWAANLHARKDPLTVLEGFEKVLADRPAARLYMAFQNGDLEAAVRDRVAASQALRRAVELVGWIPYDRLEPWFHGADLFLAGSRYEGSGYALIDALAGGAVPVVTDIPSFRFITGGVCGELWPPGDAAGLQHAVTRALSRPLEPQKQAARRLFEERWSYAAICRRALEVYRELLEVRRRSKPKATNKGSTG